MTYAQLSVNTKEIVISSTSYIARSTYCDWYRSALNIAGRIADRYDMRIETVAGVLAALSPNNRWERNIIDAENIIKCWAAGGTDEDVGGDKWHLFNNEAKALDILTRIFP